jgi:nitronate monooxygenase
MKLPQLGIGDLVSKIPIIQGGMGIGISLSTLASAVAEQGGIGVISGAMPGINEPDIVENGDQAHIRVLRREIRKGREKTKGILGVNILAALTNFGDMVRTSIEEGIDIIFSGAGLPLDLPGYLTEGVKTKLAPIVSSARAAKIICKKWWSRFNYLPDALVVEGPMAGGHIGFRPEQIEDPVFCLEKLVEEVLAEARLVEAEHGKKIPVIAAGGIFDGADIYRFLKMGAAGVQMGTRFVTTHECDASDAFKQAYVDSKEEDMVIIQSPLGLPGRAVRNSFLHEAGEGKRKPFKCLFHCIKNCDMTKSPYCITAALGQARKGKFKSGFAFAGKNAFRVKEIISVKELIDGLKMEFSLFAAQHGYPFSLGVGR